MDEPWLVGDQGAALVKADSSHPVSEPSKGSCTAAVSAQGFQTAGLCLHLRSGEHHLAQTPSRVKLGAGLGRGSRRGWFPSELFPGAKRGGAAGLCTHAAAGNSNKP